MKFLQLTLLAAVFQLSQQAEVLSRILNGTPVHPYDQSYQVKVLNYYINHTSSIGLIGECTGSLISNRHILTARHCVELWFSGIFYETKLIQVSLGSIDWREGLLIDCHSWDISADHRYCPGNGIGDIAVITMSKVVPIGHPNINIIQLPTWSDAHDFNITGKTALISGWGRTNDYNDPPNQVLNKIEVIIASPESCRRQTEVSWKFYDDEVQFCSISKYSSTCSGDSGGPVEIDGKLFGITSWGNSKMCSQTKIDVATRVLPYLGWISQVTGIKIKPQ